MLGQECHETHYETCSEIQYHNRRYCNIMATTSTPRTSPRPRITDKDWEDIATSLIEEGFLLSALELHSELLEAGKELSTLKNFFSNPGNFEQALLTPQFNADIGRNIIPYVACALHVI